MRFLNTFSRCKNTLWAETLRNLVPWVYLSSLRKLWVTLRNEEKTWRHFEKTQTVSDWDKNKNPLSTESDLKKDQTLGKCWATLRFFLKFLKFLRVWSGGCTTRHNALTYTRKTVKWTNAHTRTSHVARTNAVRSNKGSVTKGAVESKFGVKVLSVTAEGQSKCKHSR